HMQVLHSRHAGLSDQGPLITLEFDVVDSGTFTSVVNRSEARVAPEFSGISNEGMAMTVIEPVAVVAGKQTPAVPAVPLPVQSEGLEIRGAGKGSPGSTSL